MLIRVKKNYTYRAPQESPCVTVLVFGIGKFPRVLTCSHTLLMPLYTRILICVFFFFILFREFVLFFFGALSLSNPQGG